MQIDHGRGLGPVAPHLRDQFIKIALGLRVEPVVLAAAWCSGKVCAPGFRSGFLHLLGFWAQADFAALIGDYDIV